MLLHVRRKIHLSNWGPDKSHSYQSLVTTRIAVQISIRKTGLSSTTLAAKPQVDSSKPMSLQIFSLIHPYPELVESLEAMQKKCLEQLGINAGLDYPVPIDLISPINVRRTRGSFTELQRHLTWQYINILHHYKGLPDRLENVDDILSAPGLIWTNSLFHALLSHSVKGNNLAAFNQIIKRMDDLGVTYDPCLFILLMQSVSASPHLSRSEFPFRLLTKTSPESLEHRIKESSQIRSNARIHTQAFVDACCRLTEPTFLTKSLSDGQRSRQVWAKLLDFAERGDTRRFLELFQSVKGDDEKSLLILKGYLFGKQKDTDNVLRTIEQYFKVNPNSSIPTALHNQMILSFSGSPELAKRYYNENVFIPNQSTLLAIIKPLMEVGNALEVEHELALGGMTVSTKIELIVWALTSQSEFYVQELVERHFNQNQFTESVIRKIRETLIMKGRQDKVEVWERMVYANFLKERLRTNTETRLAQRSGVDDAKFKALRRAPSEKIIEYLQQKAATDPNFKLTCNHVTALLNAFSREGRCNEVEECWLWIIFYSNLGEEFPSGLPIWSSVKSTARISVLPIAAVVSYLDFLGRWENIETLETTFKFLVNLSSHVLDKNLNFFTSYVEALLRLGALDMATAFVFGGEFARFDLMPDIKYILTFITLTKMDPCKYLKKFKDHWPYAVDYKHPKILTAVTQWQERSNRLSKKDFKLFKTE